MAHFITLKSLIDRVEQTRESFSGPLPLPKESMLRLARKFLLWTVNTMSGPPVKTGALKSSGSVYVGSKKVAEIGEPIGPARNAHYQVNEPDNVITVAYSTPKVAGDKAKVFYHFGGTRWFDYAEYQHLNHATHKLWMAVLRQKGVVKAIRNEVDRVFNRIWR